MLNKIFLLALLSVVSLSAVSADAPRPEVAESVKAWTGNEGVRVWTLRYGKRADNKALVQITHADHDWDQKIQLMDVENKGDRRDYSVNVDGKKFVVLNLNNANSGELTLPGEGVSRPISYSQLLSDEGNAQYLLTDYLKQEGKLPQ
ncbi:hypothetical protein [Pantoea sp. B65]|uniref:hypothetical protein n=1 Tax=Pantoea sp. B65 TaxID=2813359 RepID=UPI0039B43956